MSQVYAEGLWGDNGAPFYSGSGSHDSLIVEPYVEAVKGFLTSFSPPITVCDLGCGDFNVGRQLVPYTKKYVAIDIVPELIAYNRDNFIHPNVAFQCLDAAKDTLPNADCVILRQVLQHLSNVEVQKIVERLYAYPYVILTEHWPDGNFVPNKDIISGQGIRLKKQSGVDICAQPFCFRSHSARQLLDRPSQKYEGRLVTTLFKV
ncbi:MAG: class I SAM-dependent methyltransferase [Bacteroidota bacterium]